MQAATSALSFRRSLPRPDSPLRLAAPCIVVRCGVGWMSEFRIQTVSFIFSLTCGLL